MKKAFTMAETLITMGIIGVVAALTLPAVNQLRPDEAKIKYLKAFDGLQETTLAFASNSKEYPPMNEVNNNVTRNYSECPLANMSTGYNEDNDTSNTNNSLSYRNTWSGNDKLCHLLAWSLSNGNQDSCDPNGTQLQPTTAAGMPSVSFSSVNGTDWYVAFYNNNAATDWFAENVVIDVDGANNGVNCAYDADNCPHPDRFWFLITADGRVHPADPMGQAYIETRKTTGRKDLRKFIGNNARFKYLKWGDGSDDVDMRITAPQVQ